MTNDVTPKVPMGFVLLRTWFQADESGRFAGVMQLDRFDRDGRAVSSERAPTGVVVDVA